MSAAQHVVVEKNVVRQWKSRLKLVYGYLLLAYALSDLAYASSFWHMPEQVMSCQDVLESAGGPADLTASEEMAKVMVQNARESAAGEESEAMMVLHEFQKQNPPVFRGWPEPKLAEHWLSQMEKILNSMCITDDQTRVSFAVSQLEEDAVQWWRLIDQTLTWQEFRHLFMDKYFPLIFQHALEHDFLQLTQRGITVIEYEAEFSELARYALELVPDEETRIRRFLRGLKIALQHRVSLLDLHSYSEAVHRALVAEQELDNEKGCQREKRQRENTQFIGRSAKKQRTSYADYVDPDQRSCFHCGQLGHYKNGCPQREARHDFSGYCGPSGVLTSPEFSRQKTCYRCGNPGHYMHECGLNGAKLNSWFSQSQQSATKYLTP